MAAKGNQHAKGNKGGGRPPLYRAKYIAQAERAAQAGFTDKEIADLLGCGLTTLYKWKNEHPEFSEALKLNKEVADRRVEETLYKKALGVTVMESDVRVIDGEVVVTQIEKQLPPDTAAAIFWLKNRQPNRWRDKVDMVHEGGDTPIKSITEIRLVGVKPDGNPTT